MKGNRLLTLKEMGFTKKERIKELSKICQFQERELYFLRMAVDELMTLIWNHGSVKLKKRAEQLEDDLVCLQDKYKSNPDDGGDIVEGPHGRVVL